MQHRSINEVVRTPELYARAPGEIDEARVRSALEFLGTSIGRVQREKLLHDLVEVTLDLCDCGSAGLSVVKTDSRSHRFFRWDELAGAYAGYVGGTTPIDDSPCGYTLARRSPQLFFYPGKYFACLSAAEPPIVEGLVLPLIKAEGEHFGTLWIVSHSDDQQFNSAHVRVMESLCSFTIAALQVLEEMTGGQMQRAA